MKVRTRILIIAVGIAVCVAGPVTAAEDPALVRMAREVAKEVEALRGWTFKTPVAHKFASPRDVRAYLDREVAEQCPPEKIGRLQASLRLVGLLPPDCELKRTMLDLLQEQVGGYYDLDTEALYLVDRGQPMPPLVQRVVLAHELTHALDDQYVDLDAFLEPLLGKSEDQDLAAMSVVEGSATALMTRYMARAALSGRVDAGQLQSYTQREMQRSRKLLDAPRYFTAVLGAYVCGMEFLARGNLMAVLAGKGTSIGDNLLAATKDPPQSMEQILHPKKYWNEAARDVPVVLDDAAVTRVLQGGGRWVVHEDTVGELLIAILTNPPGVRRSLLGMNTASAWTNRGAAGWGGDRFYLLAAGPDAETAGRDLKDLRGVWVTLWDTPGDRNEFIETYARGRRGSEHVLVTFGNLGAVVCFGFGEADAAALVKRLGESPLAMTRGGKPWAPWAL
ncbi:MAG: hypothetical protein R6X20_18810 [Phycisphaerae bacterium]